MDYYLLGGDELVRFKNENEVSSTEATFNSQGGWNATSAFSMSASRLYIWTKSGTLKHSHFLQTTKAKEVFKVLSQAYFQKAQLSLFENEKFEPLPKSAQFSTREKADRLIEMAKMTKDKNLREEFLKAAYMEITGKTI